MSGWAGGGPDKRGGAQKLMGPGKCSVRRAWGKGEKGRTKTTGQNRLILNVNKCVVSL